MSVTPPLSHHQTGDDSKHLDKHEGDICDQKQQEPQAFSLARVLVDIMEGGGVYDLNYSPPI